MNIENGSKITDGNTAYIVLATLWNTIYLLPDDGSRTKHEYDFEIIRQLYKNIVYV